MKTTTEIAENAIEAVAQAAEGFTAITEADSLSEAKSLAYRSMAVMRKTLTGEDA